MDTTLRSFFQHTTRVGRHRLAFAAVRFFGGFCATVLPGSFWVLPYPDAHTGVLSNVTCLKSKAFVLCKGHTLLQSKPGVDCMVGQVSG